MCRSIHRVGGRTLNGGDASIINVNCLYWLQILNRLILKLSFVADKIDQPFRFCLPLYAILNYLGSLEQICGSDIVVTTFQEPIIARIVWLFISMPPYVWHIFPVGSSRKAHVSDSYRFKHLLLHMKGNLRRWELLQILILSKKTR